MKIKLDQDVAEAWAFVALHEVWIGDEHPTRKGWFLADELGRRGEPMWYKPPHRLSLVAKAMGVIGAGFVLSTLALALIAWLAGW